MSNVQEQTFEEISAVWDFLASQWEEASGAKYFRQTVEWAMGEAGYQPPESGEYVVADVLCGNVTGVALPEKILERATELILIDGSQKMLDLNVVELGLFYLKRGLNLPVFRELRLDARTAPFPIGPESVDFVYSGLGGRYWGTNSEFVDGLAESVNGGGLLWIHELSDRGEEDLLPGEGEFDYATIERALAKNGIRDTFDAGSLVKDHPTFSIYFGIKHPTDAPETIS